MDELQDQVRKMDFKVNLIAKATTRFEFKAHDHPQEHVQEVPMISIYDDDQAI